MTTVREKMLSEAFNQAERDLLNVWFEEKEDPCYARQRAWEEVSRRTRRTIPVLRLDF